MVVRRQNDLLLGMTIHWRSNSYRIHVPPWGCRAIFLGMLTPSYCQSIHYHHCGFEWKINYASLWCTCLHVSSCEPKHACQSSTFWPIQLSLYLQERRSLKWWMHRHRTHTAMCSCVNIQNLCSWMVSKKWSVKINFLFLSVPRKEVKNGEHFLWSKFKS